MGGSTLIKKLVVKSRAAVKDTVRGLSHATNIQVDIVVGEKNGGVKHILLPFWYLDRLSTVWSKSLQLQLQAFKQGLEDPDRFDEQVLQHQFTIQFQEEHQEPYAVVLLAFTILTYAETKIPTFGAVKPDITDGWLADVDMTEIIVWTLGFFHTYDCADGRDFIIAMIIKELEYNRRLDKPEEMVEGVVAYVLERYPTKGVYDGDGISNVHASICIAMVRELYKVVDVLRTPGRLPLRSHGPVQLMDFMRLYREVALIPSDSLYDILLRAGSMPDLEFWHQCAEGMRYLTFPPLDDIANADDIDPTDKRAEDRLVASLNSCRLPATPVTAGDALQTDESTLLWRQSNKPCFSMVLKALAKVGPTRIPGDSHMNWTDDHEWEQHSVFEEKEYDDEKVEDQIERDSAYLRDTLLPRLNTLARTLLLQRAWTIIPRCYFTHDEGENNRTGPYVIKYMPDDYARRHRNDDGHWLWLRRNGVDEFRFGGHGAAIERYQDVHPQLG